MIFETVVEVLVDHCDVDASTITEALSQSSLGIDSLETVEMVMELEEKLDMDELEMEEKLSHCRRIGEIHRIQTELKQEIS